MNEIFIAAGGDRRLSAAASCFEEKGCTVERVLGCGFDDIGNVIPADHLVGDGMPYTLVFNTAPSEKGRYIIDRGILKNMRRDALIIDLASAPGATDLSAAEELGIEAVNLTGVPGRYAPETAGRLIADTVYDIINRRKEVDKGDLV